jgi:peptidoglycan/xylan/chitin deacetylase (PgdA/CDA1 family)
VMVPLTKSKVRGVPVLNYHGLLFSDAGEQKKRFSLSQAVFASHLEQFKRETAAVRLLSELCCQAGRFAKSSKSMAMTFDDGRVSDYEIAFPLLVQAGFSGDFFINTATIGQPGYLTWAQMKEMHRSGMSFQSHGREHEDHSRLSRAELKHRLHQSKREIEDRLGSEVQFFAAPYGEWNRDVAEVARELGYRAICTTAGQLADPEAHIIDRICIDAETTFGEITAILVGNPLFFATRHLQYRMKRVAKALALRLFPASVDAWRERNHE